MRVIAGRFRGRTLANIGKGDPAAHLRPTTDRMRETLFNILTGGRFGDPVTDARVLDLFAGTGALGLEALSRGAAQACFVENGRKAQALIDQNIATLGVASDTVVIRRDATRLTVNPGPAYDLVFLDPPYGKGLGERALDAAWAGDWIAPGALIIWEESQPVTPPDGIDTLEVRRQGQSNLTICQATARVTAQRG